jgi:hypothetical protein
VSGDDRDGALAEFAALREEMLYNGNKRQGIYLFQVGATGAVLSFCAASAGHLIAGFILPIISFQLGTRYYDYGLDIAKTGKYIREELHPRVPGGLGWEIWRSGLPGINPWLSRYYQHLLTFLAPAILGWILGVWGSLGRNETWIANVGLSAISISSLVVVLLIYASWRSHERAATKL